MKRAIKKGSKELRNISGNLNISKREKSNIAIAILKTKQFCAPKIIAPF